MLGLLFMDKSAHPVRAMAIINAMNDNGPAEILLLRSHMKTNYIFSRAVSSFVDLLNYNYNENVFFVFGTRPKKITLNNIPSISNSPFIDDKYVALWGPELSDSNKKNSWPIGLLDKTHKEIVGEFQAVDVIKEVGMDDMLLKIRRDGTRG